MRHSRLIAAIVGLATLLVVPAASTARPPSSPDPQLDTATATGDNLIIDDFSSTDIQVDAHSGPSGENPGGQVSFVAGKILPISGPVTCLDVAGNTAVMTVAGPFPSAPQFNAFIVRLVDNGGAGLDRFEYFPENPADPGSADCQVGSPAYVGGSLIGRALLSDVDPQPPVPTSKKQCRRGGFAHFGFKNKGKCISYVVHHRHGGKHP